MPVHTESHEQSFQGPDAGDLFRKLTETGNEPLPEEKYVGRHREVPFTPEGPTRRDIKNALTAKERRDLSQASRIVRRVLGHTALPVIGDTVPLEPMMQRGLYSDEAVAIASDRLSKPYGLDVVVEDSKPIDTYEDTMYPGESVRPYRVVRIEGVNDNANHTPTSHRK
jgi:hypothetical protein